MPRSIDHLVLAVRDLDGAGRLYERLGFQVGARNRHPWGTENRLVQLPGAFLELITVGEGAETPPHGPRRFSFGAFVRDALSRREGLAMLALASTDAAADARLFAGAGIGDFEPFFFERTGRRPDGSEIRVAFTLAFAVDPAAREAGFFVSQHHNPENFWNSAFQQHPNGAQALASVVLASPEPRRHRAFLTTLTGAAPVDGPGAGLLFRLGSGRRDVLTPEDAGAAFGSVSFDPAEAGFAAFAVRLDDAARHARRLDAAGIPYRTIGSRLVVPPSAAGGVAIGFEPA
jgi:catechol 2,3-dioxygenase-like lactoylglutathione lyase family enzyme